MPIGPLQFAIYKGTGGKWGACQFNLQPPHFYIKGNSKLKNFDGRYIREEWLRENPNLAREDLVSREGAVFVEITSATAPNKYDWDRKIVIALSIHDMGRILHLLEAGQPGDKCSLMHDPGAKTEHAGQVRKILDFNSPKGPREGGVMLSATIIRGEADRITHTIPISATEVRTLAILLRTAVATSLGW